MIKLIISRFLSLDKQTLSTFKIEHKNSREIFLKGYILELPDKDNKRRISRIPAGKYKCVKRFSEKYKHHFHVLDVPDRDYILIHSGNYHTHTKGCLLPGSGITDINNDGYQDVVNSKSTMKKMNELLPKEFYLEIEEEE